MLPIVFASSSFVRPTAVDCSCDNSSATSTGHKTKFAFGLFGLDS